MHFILQHVTTDTNCRSSMLRDTEFFKSRISKIDGAGDIGDYLINLVNAKAVAAQPTPLQETPATTVESTEKHHEADGEEKK